MTQHVLEMQERLFVADSAEPEPPLAQPEMAPSSEDSNALIQSAPAASGNSEGQQAEAEPPRLSRDEELISTATKMYRLGFCFLCASPLRRLCVAPLVFS